MSTHGGQGVRPGDTHRGQGGEAGWLFVLYRDKWYLWKRGFTVVQILSKLCMKALLGHEYYNNVYPALSIVFISKFQSHEIVCWTNTCIEWLSLNNPGIILIIPIFISTLSLICWLPAVWCHCPRVCINIPRPGPGDNCDNEILTLMMSRDSSRVPWCLESADLF